KINVHPTRSSTKLTGMFGSRPAAETAPFPPGIPVAATTAPVPVTCPRHKTVLPSCPSPLPPTSRISAASPSPTAGLVGPVPRRRGPEPSRHHRRRAEAAYLRAGREQADQAARG